MAQHRWQCWQLLLTQTPRFTEIVTIFSGGIAVIAARFSSQQLRSVDNNDGWIRSALESNYDISRN
jgi:hypothetical protein